MAGKNSDVERLAKALFKEQSEKNWGLFPIALKKSTVKYYRIVWANEGKLNKMQDLTKSFAELYDSKFKMIAEVPIFVKTGKKLRGATKYLIGLEVLNR